MAIVSDRPLPTQCITVIIPVNTHRGVQQRSVALLLGSPLIREVLVVGDASPHMIDDECFDGRLRFVASHMDLGYGTALVRGAAEASTPIILLLDPDLALSPTEVTELVGPLVDNAADVVHGFRPITPHWSTRVAAALTGLALIDPAITCTAMHCQLFSILDLQADGPGVRAALASEASRRRLNVVEVPISTQAAIPGRIRGRGDMARHLVASFRHSRWWPRRNISHPSDFDAADAQLAATLADLDSATGNYARWIVGMCTPHLGSRVLEIGAGHGTMTRLLASDARHVTASDLSERCVQELRVRFDGNPWIDVIHGDSHALGPAEYDSAVLVNVLEHIDDDVAALASIRNSLRPGGRVCIFTPAFEGLYSEFDRKVGHHRRYRHSTLAMCLDRAGYRIVDIRYVNLPGAFAWWLIARQLRITPTHSGLAGVYDRFVVPLTRRIETRVNPPFGQSLFAIGERPTETVHG